MAEDKVIIQSFHPYDLTVNYRHTSGPKKGEPVMEGTVAKTTRIPSLHRSPKNIAIFSSEDFRAVEEDLTPYIEKGRDKGMVRLKDIPAGFWDPAQRVAQAEGNQAMAEGKLAASEAKVARLEDEVEVLKRRLRDYGATDV